MKFKKIQLSGFKSFVDPTTLTFPADMIGIVGPNGCGKSNIIDAIRWVMGEGSARTLRGGSMDDVIFNGSSARKPVGKASVELVFDNAAGRVGGGMHSRFAEISIRRTLARDEPSEYFLNNTRCRRRDIADIFHGTGLGPRSYSIIEQGMVSRIVEAKPEELRAFVEEAAGISRYKERRRETETRIRHTRENLQRVEDIRRELEAQLRRLQRQSQQARRYQALKQEEHEVNTQLLALRWREEEERLAAVNAEVSRLQTESEGKVARVRESEARMEEMRAAHAGEQESLNLAQARFYSVQADISALEQRMELARETHARQQSGLQQAREEVEKARRHVQGDREKRGAVEADIAQLQPRLMQLQAEREQAAEALARASGDLEAELAELDKRIRERRKALEARRGGTDQVRARLQAAAARLASLRDLQRHALGEDDQALAAWLQDSGLDQLPRLAGRVRVSGGWERALDRLLGDKLSALCADSVELAAAPPAGPGLVLVERGGKGEGEGGRTGRLLNYVECDEVDLGEWLAGVRTAENLPEALRRRRELAPGECVATRDGVLAGRRWLSYPPSAGHEDGFGDGVLQREQEIEKTTAAHAQIEKELQERAEVDEAAQAELAGLEEQRVARQQRWNEHAADLAELHKRLGQSDESGGGEGGADSGGEHGEGGAPLQSAAVFGAGGDDDGGALRKSLKKLRGRVEATSNAFRECELKLQSLQATRDSLLEQEQRAGERLAHLLGQEQGLSRDLESAAAPGDDAARQLEALLKQKVEAEQKLQQARRKVEQLDEQLRAAAAARQQLEQEAQEARGAVEEKRVARQEFVTRQQTLREQMEETGAELKEVVDALPEDAEAAAWDSRLAAIRRKVERIGAVNLVAIDEFEEQSQRKEYLDRQSEDLNSALQTLEEAMRKIDRETRTRFKETFERLNGGFQEYFPRLFGGGSAALELTGDDYLSAGVTVTARPPGKRNSTIHLLSGGEKALTAVALLFSLFELNPAPFCLLDEVDAPLDDANVERYCETLRSMAQKTQLIFVTHNKITMEAANILMGVTMGEPGVSRLVSVNVEEAVQMAAEQ
ncbi:MAG: AAA family ATPase [Gammaproteobacteria bacterium]|nr:AAA family ATPase [Gammaproteobacteria bacterium]